MLSIGLSETVTRRGPNTVFVELVLEATTGFDCRFLVEGAVSSPIACLLGMEEE